MKNALKNVLFKVLVIISLFLTPVVAQAATLYFETDGGTPIDPLSVYRNDVVMLDYYLTTKDGYNFIGWFESPTSDNQVTIFNVPWYATSYSQYYVYARWNIATYKIKYNLNGGIVKGTNPTSYTIKTSTILLNNPTKEGFEFLGWTGTNGTTPKKQIIIPYGSFGDREYEANWKEETNTLTFVTNGGTTTTNTNENVIEMPKSTVLSGSDFDNYTTSKKGYIFEGWFDETLENKIDSFSFQTSGSVYAKYSLDNYSIEYDLDGGTDPQNPTTYNIESSDITLKNPTKEGHKFLGWTGSNGETPELSVTISAGSTEDKKYKANWEAEEYVLSFETNGGSKVIEITEKYGTIVDLSNIISEKIDNTFEGWYSDADLKNKIDSVKMDKDITVYAKWKFIYKIISGENQTHIKVKDGDLTIISNGDKQKLVRIEIDGKVLFSTNYTTKQGSTILTLKKSYLDSLKVGKYLVTFVYNDGSVSTNFKVEESTSPSTDLNNNNINNLNVPQTGVNVNAHIWYLLLGLIALSVWTLYLLKSKQKELLSK